MPKLKNVGLFADRCKTNPLEDAVARQWKSDPKRLQKIMGDKFDVTQRDATVAATVIQWTGSPAGDVFHCLTDDVYARKTGAINQNIDRILAMMSRACLLACSLDEETREELCEKLDAVQAWVNEGMPDKETPKIFAESLHHTDFARMLAELLRG